MTPVTVVSGPTNTPQSFCTMPSVWTTQPPNQLNRTNFSFIHSTKHNPL